MADFTWFGTEQDPCPNHSINGCTHAIGIHSERADGCSHIGPSGWCECGYIPTREGAAKLLDESVPVGHITHKTGASAGLVPINKLIPKSQTYFVGGGNRNYTNPIRCAALVKASAGFYRPCKKLPEFWRDSGSGAEAMVCFTHMNVLEVTFSL